MSHVERSMTASQFPREGAHEVLAQAAPRDVGHAGHDVLHLVAALQLHDVGGVDPRGREQHLTERPGGFDFPSAPPFGLDVQLRNDLGQVEFRVLDHLADERIAVGVDAAGGQPDHDVAGRDALRVHGALELDDTDAESREVEIARGVEVGHLGRFAAEERAPGLFAPLDHAADQVGQHRLLDLRHRDVVKEEERLGPLHDEVVDVHRDQVNADRVVHAEHLRELDLGPHAVGARDQHRLLVVARKELLVVVEAEEPREPAGVVDDARPEGAAHQRRKGVGERVLLVQADARGGVRQAGGGPVGISGAHARENRGERASVKRRSWP
jgi:hypothetical protein